MKAVLPHGLLRYEIALMCLLFPNALSLGEGFYVVELLTQYRLFRISGSVACAQHDVLGGVVGDADSWH